MRTILLIGSLLCFGGVEAGWGQSPGEVATRFASAWEARDDGGIQGLLSPAGVRLRLDGDGHGGVAPRRVLRALESYWRDRTGGEVTVTSVSLMETEESRAYGELEWLGVNEVTGEAFEATIFLGLSEGEEGWRVDEIRTITPD